MTKRRLYRCVDKFQKTYKMASSDLGRMPGFSELPWIVKVLPEDVAPYVKIS
jgi:hypothetical protein